MERKAWDNLGELQRTVLETVWEMGEAGVHQVRERLNRKKKKLAYTTVLSAMQKLEKAGWSGASGRGSQLRVYGNPDARGGRGGVSPPLSATGLCGRCRRPVSAPDPRERSERRRTGRVKASPRGEREVGEQTMMSEIFAHHPWLWPLAWQSTLCLTAGLGGSFLLRRHAVRAHQVLLLALVAAVLIPALSQVVKWNQWGLLVAERAVAIPQRQAVAAPIDFAIPDRPIAGERTGAPAPIEIPVVPPAPAATRFDWRGPSYRPGLWSVRSCWRAWRFSSCLAGDWPGGRKSSKIAQSST